MIFLKNNIVLKIIIKVIINLSKKIKDLSECQLIYYSPFNLKYKNKDNRENSMIASTH